VPKQQEPTLSRAAEKIGFQRLVFSPPTLATGYNVGCVGEVLKMDKSLMILYHDMNQKAKPGSAVPLPKAAACGIVMATHKGGET
jgi:hypothetical protein